MLTILVPAYGRTYASKEQALEDWEIGKDFKIEGGPYCTISDAEAMKEELSPSLSIRWQPNLYVFV